MSSNFQLMEILFFCIFIGVLALYVSYLFSTYKEYKVNLLINDNSRLIQPRKSRFVFSWFIRYLCLFIPTIPIAWLMNDQELPISYLWLAPLITLFLVIPEYPRFTLVTDEIKLKGPTMWGRKIAEINLDEIDREKVLRQNFGKRCGITIFYSTRGVKILTLGLDNLQISKILEATKRVHDSHVTQ